MHINICDIKSISQGGKSIYTFTVDCTGSCYVFLLNSKDETIEAFKQYKIEVKNQFNKKINMIRSDRGGEHEYPFAEIYLELPIKLTHINPIELWKRKK